MNIRPSTGFSSPSPSFGPRSVVVLMSGGVDSSVTAWLLKKEGRHVAGLTMRIPGQDGLSSGSCCGRTPPRWPFPYPYPTTWPTLRRNSGNRSSPLRGKLSRGGNPQSLRRLQRRPEVRAPLGCPGGCLRSRLPRHGALRQGSPFGERMCPCQGSGCIKRPELLSLRNQEGPASGPFLPLGDRSKEEVRELAREAGLAVAEKGKHGDLFRRRRGLPSTHREPFLPARAHRGREGRSPGYPRRDIQLHRGAEERPGHRFQERAVRAQDRR